MAFLPRRRVVALALIALTIAGLGVARVAGAPDARTCAYPAGTAKLPARCGTLVVPEHRHDARWHLVALPLAGLAVLVAIARRLRRRGHLKMWPSVVVRSLFAGALGIAGWLLAVVAVLAGSVAVAVDDRSLVMVAVAIPVAAAVSVGWADRARERRGAVTGLAACVSGAVIGAWVGSAVAQDFAAVLTAVAGSVAAANLALIACDVAAGGGLEPVQHEAEAERELVPVAVTRQ